MEKYRWNFGNRRKIFQGIVDFGAFMLSAKEEREAHSTFLTPTI